MFTGNYGVNMDPNRPLSEAVFIIAVLLSALLWAAFVFFWAWFSYT